MTAWRVLSFLLLAAAPSMLFAQNGGYLEGADCGSLHGWVWDSSNPNNAVNVDLYDSPISNGMGALVATVTANQYRADLAAAGIGNGYHAFSYATPPTLKDGRTHYISAYYSGTLTRINAGGLPLSCPAGSTGYQPYFSSSLSTLPSGTWTSNGSLTAGSNGLSSAGTGSAILSQAAPTDPNSYAVDMTLNLTASGGTYVTYLRATSNAISGSSPQGTFYSVEVQNVTMSGTLFSATLAVNGCVNGSITNIGLQSITIHNGSTVRSVIRGATIYVYVDGQHLQDTSDGAIAGGQPGVGASSTGSNSLSSVRFGPTDTTRPSAVSGNSMASSVSAGSVLLRWQPPVDDPNGSGIAYYWLLRRTAGGNFTGVRTTSAPLIADTGLAPGTYYYQMCAYDYFGNTGCSTTNYVTVPSAGSVDPRQIGVRPTGSYYGAAGEQIDMRSGNLNYTVPLVKPMGRGGWGVGFNLSYNSQNWAQDNGTQWKLGNDTGYGFGWKLQAGSLTPIYSGVFNIAYYLFVDATGAEYLLDQNSNGVWTSKQGIYLSYDTNSQHLYFNDGSYWYFGCTSAGTEQDAGTMYPTSMEDTNGNQITIQYAAGVGATWTNSSARVLTISDVRYSGAYSFGYTEDWVPHLISVTSKIGDGATYYFSIASGQPLNEPFGGQTFGSTALLSSVTQGTNQLGQPGLTTSFSYDPGGSGELVRMTTPYGGQVNWQYTSFTLQGQRTEREVNSRSVLMKPGGTLMSYQLTRDSGDASRTIHLFGRLLDVGGNASKVWTFQTDTTQAFAGLQTSYEGRQEPSGMALTHVDYTWATTPSSGNPYISQVLTTDNSNNSPVQRKTTQTLDRYGNLTQMQGFDYPNIGWPVRTYTNTYVTDSRYTTRYMVNRLATTSVMDVNANVTTLAQNCYDGMVGVAVWWCGGGTTITDPGAGTGATMAMHDGNYGTGFPYRGNLTRSDTLTASVTNAYDMGGNVVTTTNNGVTTSSATNSSFNFGVPSQLTTNVLSTQLNWTSWFGLQQATGPNGETTSFGYDSYARPASSTSSMGVVTKYYYADTATPPVKYAITNGHGTRTTMDGFGRTTRVETGAASGTWGYNFAFTPVSAVDTAYAACACSPLGKLWKTSQPYTSGGSASAWTVYTYDALGRTTKVTLPDGSNTTYAYSGQQVTVTDPAGKWKTFTMDAFGNLTTVLEPDPTLGNVITNYTYDALNHLTQVSMPRGSTTQTRTFNYKVGTALTGYLQSATNPENGTVSYTYSNGLPATKTDARNQQIQYSYDGYHRLTQVSHFPATGGAEDLNQRVSYYYDTNPDDPNGTFSTNTLGRLAEVKYYQSFLSEWYGYAGGPQVTQKRLQIQQHLVWQDTWGNGQSGTYPLNFDATYTYNAEARLSAITYPNPGSTSPGPGYTYTFDSLGRPSGMMDSNNNWVVSNAVYGPANELLSLNYGNPYMAPFETRTYNNLLQLTAVTYSSVGGTQMSRTYNYPAGSNNGKINSAVDNVSGESVQYQYDSLNRLMAASATAGPSPWGQSFTYDGFGNLTGKNVTQGSAPTLSVVVDPATNRAGGSTYDANGNQLQYAGHTLNYDIENRLVYASGSWPYGTSYYYDGGNRRVVRYDSSAFDQYGNPTSYLVYFNGADGKWVSTYQVTTAVGIGDHGTQASVSAQGVAGGNLHFGSKRLGVYDRLGSAKANSAGFYPYGEDKGTMTPNDNWKFATYWRESVTGLDYAVNRWYGPGNGRFLTPDPHQTSGGPGAPQSWNRYAYVAGDPINEVDPAGLDGYSPDNPWGDMGICDPYDHIFDPAKCLDLWNEVYLTGLPGSTIVNPNFVLQLDPLPILQAYLTAFPNELTPVAFGFLEDACDCVFKPLGSIDWSAIWGDIVTFLKAQQFGQIRTNTYEVSCAVHPIGTPNHAGVVRITVQVVATDAASALAFGKQLITAEAQARFGPAGFHLQHCNVKQI